MIGDSILMLNQSSADYLPIVSQIHLYVDDVDTTHCGIDAGRNLDHAAQ